MYIVSSHNNIIKENTLADSLVSGIHVLWSSETTIFHNNLINNLVNAYDSNPSVNTWYNSVNEGNYWSDYQGLDDGSGGRVAGDGIGDTDLPHLGLDNYPLMFPVGIVHNVDLNTWNAT